MPPRHVSYWPKEFRATWFKDEVSSPSRRFPRGSRCATLTGIRISTIHPTRWKAMSLSRGTRHLFQRPQELLNALSPQVRMLQHLLGSKHLILPPRHSQQTAIFFIATFGWSVDKR